MVNKEDKVYGVIIRGITAMLSRQLGRDIRSLRCYLSDFYNFCEWKYWVFYVYNVQSTSNILSIKLNSIYGPIILNTVLTYRYKL